MLLSLKPINQIVRWQVAKVPYCFSVFCSSQASIQQLGRLRSQALPMLPLHTPETTRAVPTHCNQRVTPPLLQLQVQKCAAGHITSHSTTDDKSSSGQQHR